MANSSANDKRRHLRCPVSTSVILQDSQGRTVPATMRDICVGGVYIEEIGHQRRAQITLQQDLVISFHLPVDGALRGFTIPSTVVRLVDTGMGVSFNETNLDTTAAIRRFIESQLNKPSSGLEPKQIPTFLSAQAKETLQQLTEARIENLLIALFKAIEAALWEVTEQAISDTEKYIHITDATLFTQSGMSQGAQHCKTRIIENRGEAPSAEGEEILHQELSLVDSDSFELWLESSTLARRLEDELKEPLQIVRSQAKQVFNSESLPHLEPETVANALLNAFEAISANDNVIRNGFKAAREALPPLLNELYWELGRAWEKIGIKPLDEKIQPVKVERERPQAGDPSTPLTQSSGSAVATATGNHSQLVRVDAGPSSHHVADLLRSFPLNSLSAMDASTAQYAFKEQVIALLSQANQGTAENLLDNHAIERIDATDRVLTHILEENDNPPQLRSWINDLSLQLLANSIDDFSFFRGTGHPLLKIIGQLEQLGVFLPSKENVLEDEIDALLQEIHGVDNSDPAVFTQIGKQLEEIESRYVDRFKAQVIRSINTLKGREKHRHVQQLVEGRLHLLFSGKKIHTAVNKLIESGWKRLLEALYSIEQGEGKRFNRALLILQHLHRICGGDDLPDGSEAPLGKLISRVREGLAYVQTDPATINEVALGLEKAALQVEKLDTKTADFVAYSDSHLFGQESSTTSPPSSIEDDEWQDAAKMVENLTINASIAIKEQGQDYQQQYPLVWKSSDNNEYAFLDPQGHHLKLLSKESLASGFLSGDYRIISQSNRTLVDKALEATLDEMHQKVDFHKHRDALTGLDNRGSFLSKLTALLTQDSKERYILGILEIDQFNAITGICGYAAGDQLIETVSRQLKDQLGATAQLAFFGGQRFGFIVEQSQEPDLQQLVAGINQVCNSNPFIWEGKCYLLSFSIGLATFTPGESPDSLFSAAHLACSSAQESGGDRAIVFGEDDEVISEKREKMEWLIKTEDVIKAQRMRLRGQKITPVDPESGLSPHYEILLSTFDDEGLPLSLDDFISTAETFNRMKDVDIAVIKNVFSWAGENSENLKTMGGIAINLSGQSLTEEGLAAYIQEQLTTHGISPELISFEITETAAIANIDKAVEIVNEIKQLGCKVALDDFGMGLSSFNYLKKLPIDYLKIDGSFIRNILNNPDDEAIVKSINEIAHFMGIRTIAEYVETAKIGEHLATLGLDYMQGYSVEKPVFLDELTSIRAV